MLIRRGLQFFRSTRIRAQYSIQFVNCYIMETCEKVIAPYFFTSKCTTYAHKIPEVKLLMRKALAVFLGMGLLKRLILQYVATSVF